MKLHSKRKRTQLTCSILNDISLPSLVTSDLLERGSGNCVLGKEGRNFIQRICTISISGRSGHLPQPPHHHHPHPPRKMTHVPQAQVEWFKHREARRPLRSCSSKRAELLRVGTKGAWMATEKKSLWGPVLPHLKLQGFYSLALFPKRESNLRTNQCQPNTIQSVVCFGCNASRIKRGRELQSC